MLLCNQFIISNDYKLLMFSQSEENNVEERKNARNLNRVKKKKRVLNKRILYKFHHYL